MPTRWRIALKDNLGEISSTEWDSMAASASFYSSYGWLRSVEWHPTLRSRYLVLRDSTGSLAAGAPLYEADGLLNPNYNIARLLNLADASGDLFPGLLLASRGGYWSDLPVRTTLTSDHQDDALRELLDAAIRFAQDGDYRSLAAIYLPTSAMSALVSLKALAGPYLVGAGCRAYVEWRDFDDYLDSFRHKRRGNIRREIEQFEKSGYSVDITDLASSHELLAPLLANVHRRHGETPVVERFATYFSEQAAHVNDSSRVFLLRAGRRIVGFDLEYEWRKGLYGRVVGLDYRELQGAGEYFNLSIYAPIRYAIDRRLEFVDFGPGSYEAKVRRGAKLNPLWALLWTLRRDCPVPETWNARWLEDFLAHTQGFADLDFRDWTWSSFS
jgi:predicted N-acyltransferase